MFNGVNILAMHLLRVKGGAAGMPDVDISQTDNEAKNATASRKFVE